MGKKPILALVLVFVFVTSLVLGCAQPAPPPAPAPAPAPTTPAPVPATPAPAPAPAPAPEVKPIVLKVGHYSGVYDARHAAWLYWGELVKEASGGRLEFEVHPASTLVGIVGQVAAMRDGLADMTPTWPTTNPEFTFVADFGVIVMPTDWEKSVAFGKEYIPFVQPEFDRLGIRAIWFQDVSYDQEWWFKDPVVPGTGGDLMRNKIIRSIGPAPDDLIRNLGGSPCQIPGSEFYTAAEAGTVDGTTFGTPTFAGWGFWPVMPHMVIANMFTAGACFSITQDAWNKLTPDLQGILQDTGDGMAEWFKPHYERANQIYVGEGAFKYGGSAYTLTKEERQIWLDAAAPWNAEMKEKWPVLFPQFEALVKKYQ